MWLDLGRLVLGGVCLYFGAEWLVAGAAGLATRAGIKPLIVGLTIVSWGTSAPELVVSALAAVDGAPEIALGNIIGSNVANLGLILGITALITPPHVAANMLRREVPVLVLSAGAIPLVLLNGEIGRAEGAGLLGGAILFTIWLVRSNVAAPSIELEVAEAAEELSEAVPPHPHSPLRLALLGVAGLAVLVVGGHVFVGGATGLALAVGMSERVVGLTVVAIGTSLPEMATSLIAALRGHSDIAVGNVVGSNVFNVLLVLGAASTIHPIAGELDALEIDLAVMGGLTLAGAVMLRTERTLTRVEGGLLAGGYLAYLGWLVIAG